MNVEEHFELSSFFKDTKFEIAKAAVGIGGEVRRRASTGEVLPITPALEEEGVDERIIFSLKVPIEGVPLLGYNASVTGTHALLERSGSSWSERVVIGAQLLPHPDSELIPKMNASVSISSKGVAALQINNGSSDGGDMAFTTAADNTPDTLLAKRTSARRGLVVAEFTLAAFNQVHGMDYTSAGKVRALQERGDPFKLGEIPITPFLLRQRPQ